jgi:Sulfatase
MFNGIADGIEANLPHLEELGSPATYNHYPTGWAFNTPFKMWERYSNFEGGAADPMIVSWPKRITSTGLRRQYVHAVDIVPTIYSLLGIEPPEVVKGYTQFPLEGIRFDATLNDAAATTDKQTQFYSMGGTRAIWSQGWKAAAISPAAPDAWAGYATQRWELFNTDEDPTECHDLADQEPEKLQELTQLWWAQAGQYGALPLENRNAIEILTTDRPQLTKPRNQYVYYPGCAEVRESVAPASATARTRSRSRSPGLRGCARCPVRSRGPVRRPRSLHQGPQAQVRVQLRRGRRADHRVHRVAARWPRGRLGLFRARRRLHASRGDPHPARRGEGDREGRIKTQPGKCSISGEGLNVGKDGAEPVTDDYPGDAPWRFTGGTIVRAAVDVSGEPFVDLAAEARMAFMRD